MKRKKNGWHRGDASRGLWGSDPGGSRVWGGSEFAGQVVKSHASETIIASNALDGRQTTKDVPLNFKFEPPRAPPRITVELGESRCGRCRMSRMSRFPSQNVNPRQVIREFVYAAWPVWMLEWQTICDYNAINRW